MQTRGLDEGPPTGGVERRRHPRYDLDIPVLVRIVIAEETFTPRRFPGRCVDISPGGARVKIRGIRKGLYKTLIHGHRTMQLHMSIPEAGGEAMFEGNIVHADYHVTRRGGECVLGAAFRDLQESQAEALEALLRSLRMKVLIADNDEATILAITRFFVTQGHQVVAVDSGLEALGYVRSEAPDVVFLGIALPDLDGLRICQEIKADRQVSELCILVMGTEKDGETRRKALDAGADGFLAKPIENTELLERHTVACDLVEYQKSLRAVALTDPLTGLSNRRSFDAAFRRETERARLTSVPLALLVIDIDRFKEINDRYGHDKGDRVLRRVAQLIIEAVGIKDAVFRIGGDEFAVLLSALKDTARSHVERLEQAFIQPDSGEEFNPDYPGVSVGVAHYNPSESPEEFFSRADASMYKNKRKRRTRGS